MLFVYMGVHRTMNRTLISNGQTLSRLKVQIIVLWSLKNDNFRRQNFIIVPKPVKRFLVALL
jgi:hypothetical protein